MLDLGRWLAYARREIGLTSALLLFAALALGFLALDRTMGGGGFDRALLLALRTPGDPADPIGSARFEEAARDITALGASLCSRW